MTAGQACVVFEDSTEQEFSLQLLSHVHNNRPGRHPEATILAQEPTPNFIIAFLKISNSSRDHPGASVQFHRLGLSALLSSFCFSRDDDIPTTNTDWITKYFGGKTPDMGETCKTIETLWRMSITVLWGTRTPFNSIRTTSTLSIPQQQHTLHTQPRLPSGAKQPLQAPTVTPWIIDKLRWWQRELKLAVYTGQWNKLDLLQAEIKQHTSVTWNGLLWARSQQGSLAEAEHLFKEMLAHRCVPNLRSCNALMRLYAHTPGKEDQAHAVFQQMKTTWKLQPDETSYHCVITAYCQQQRMQEAEQAVQEMQQQGFPLSKEVYSILAQGYSQVGNQKELRRCMLAMQSTPAQGQRAHKH